ncbi:MAG: hypothetical protein ACOC1G_04830 [Phycisphaeraceae bacterium]
MTMLADILWRPFFLPLPTLAGAALLVVLAVVWFVRVRRTSPWRASVLLVMRLVAVGVITLVLMGPSVEPEPKLVGDKPDLTVLVDTSGSMQTADMEGQPRIAYVSEQWLSEERLRALERRFDVELVAFAESPRSTSASVLSKDPAVIADAGVTNLAASVEQTLSRLRGGDGSSVLVLSDGRDSHSASLAAAAELSRAKSLPVFASVLGGATLQRDLAVHATVAQPFLLVNETGSLSIEVRHANALGSRSTLRVTRGDGTTVEQRELAFTDASTQRLSLPVRHEEPGLYEYDIAVAPLDDEVEPANNRRRVFVEVTDKRLKVLLLEGQPFWDTKFLAQSLRKDDRIELTQLSQISSERRQQLVTRTDGKATIPATLEDFAAYDVVILGRAIERVLPADAWESLTAYVAQHGGRLILARGQPYDLETRDGKRIARLLSPLEPVVWGGGQQSEQRLVLTPEGRSHPVFAGEDLDLIEQAPAMTWTSDVTRAKAAARVLVKTSDHAGSTGTDRPVVVSMPYDRGQVLALLGEGLWRWRLSGRGDPEVDAAYDRFWSGMVRFLAMGSDYRPGQNLAFSLSRRNVPVGDTVHGELTRRNPQSKAHPTLTLLAPDGGEQKLDTREESASTLRFRFQASQQGVYRLIASPPDQPGVVALETRLSASELDEERLYASADPAALRELAEGSGGRMLDPRKPAQLIEALERHTATMNAPGPPRYLWDRGWLLVLLTGVLGMEWIARRAGGWL